MSGFVKKILCGDESCGSLLRAQRNASNLSIEDVSLHTGIQSRYLEMIEEDAFDGLPGEWYIRKYLSVYAQALNVPSQELLTRYDQSRIQSRRIVPFSLREVLPSSRFIVWPKRIAILSVAAGVGIFLTLLALRVGERLNPPALIVIYPPEGYITHVDTIVLSGKSESEARITVNGESLVPEQDGSFSLMVHLSPGVNLFTVTAKRRFGQRAEEYLRVVKDGIAQGATSSP